MEGYFLPKMKRKDIDDTKDDFSDISLSSPATKIRRLGVQLPAIIEEEQRELPIMLEQSQQPEQSIGSNESGGLEMEELPSLAENQERAIVLYKPIRTAPLSDSPPNFSVSVDPNLLSGFKSHVLSWRQSNSWRRADGDEAVREHGDAGSANGCEAVVPWVPLRHPCAYGADFPPQIDNAEEEVGEATMEVEDSASAAQPGNGGGMPLSEGVLHQWQQPCMIPKPPPQNTTTPVFWLR